MRALTLTQPWAALVALGIKRIENRSRPMIRAGNFHRPIAIHASREVDLAVYHRIDELWPRCGRYLGDNDATCPQLTCTRRTGHAGLCDNVGGEKDDAEWVALSRVTSAVIGVATVEDAVMIGGCSREHIDEICAERGMPDQARWMFGPTSYITKDNRALAAPIACRGWQGLWTLHPDVAGEIEAQIDRRSREGGA